MNRNDTPLLNEVKDSSKICDDISRRNFAKKLLGIGALTSLGVSIVPEAAMAWLDGKFSEREDLEDGIKFWSKHTVTQHPTPTSSTMHW